MKNEIEQLSLWNCFTRAFGDKIHWMGRATRKEYWGHTLIAFLLWTVIDTMFGALIILGVMVSSDGSFGILMGILGCVFLSVLELVYMVYSLRLTAARLHDSGQSAWLILVGLVPFIGWIFLLVFLCMDSQRCTNKWGPCRLECQDEVLGTDTGVRALPQGAGAAEVHVATGAEKEYWLKVTGECAGVVRLNSAKLEKKPLTIGRSPSCRMQLRDGKISARHCVITGSGGNLILCDLGSRNGTHLNGVRLKPNRNVVLHSGHVITIGDTRMEVRRA